MIEEFKKYVSNYDIDNKKVELKLDHSLRVMELSKKYSEMLNFSADDKLLAIEIGLLHDVGRFEQIKRYDTFNDLISVDHGLLGSKILFEEKLIENFSISSEHYEIIRKAIENHNRYQIEDGLNKRELMHAKLIRDTDKLDILYNAAYLDYIDISTEDENVSFEVLEDIKNRRTVNSKNKKNKNDRIASFFAFAFDINNNACLEEIKEYIEVIYNRIEYKGKLKEVYNLVINYIEERN